MEKIEGEVYNTYIAWLKDRFPAFTEEDFAYSDRVILNTNLQQLTLLISSISRVVKEEVISGVLKKLDDESDGKKS